MPNRKGKHLKILQGTDREEREKDYPKYEPKFNAEPPTDMPEQGRKLWEKLSPILEEYGVLTVIDEVGFTELCYSYGKMKQIEQQLNDEGYSIDDERGSMKKNPLFTQAKFYREQFNKYAKEYGLFANSRQQLDLPEPKNNKDIEIEKLLSGTGNLPK